VELSEGALLDMLEEIGMDADLDSHSQTSDDDLEDSCLDIPDNGVCRCPPPPPPPHTWLLEPVEK